MNGVITSLDGFMSLAWTIGRVGSSRMTILESTNFDGTFISLVTRHVVWAIRPEFLVFSAIYGSSTRQSIRFGSSSVMAFSFGKHAIRLEFNYLTDRSASFQIIALWRSALERNVSPRILSTIHFEWAWHLSELSAHNRHEFSTISTCNDSGHDWSPPEARSAPS